MTKQLLKHRRPFIAVLHLALVAFSNYAAFWLRFDGAIPPRDLATMNQTLLVVVALRGMTFVPFRMYGGLWRYAGIWDLKNIIGGVSVSSLLCFVVIRDLLGFSSCPRSVFIIDALILLNFLGGIRLVRRLWGGRRRPNARRVLIFGAGDAGEMIVRDMLRYRHYRPVGFLDDDVNKRGHRIHGVPVLGGRADLARIVRAESPDEVLVAIAQPSPATVRGLVRLLEPFKVSITSVPPIRDLLDRKVTVSQIRSLSIEDLLARAPVDLDSTKIESLVSNRRVLITGAGGSIGSELSRQVAAFCPQSLTLFERYENSLYTVTNSLLDLHPALKVKSVIGDITDAARLDMVFAEEQPEIVFHAAAHKHVPLMELNVCEAVKNNVAGTRRVAEAAIRHGVDSFVLISSDKAVNPSSVMGTTKRVAELVVRRLARQGVTRFITVRFGNVLGSNGSVVPRFLDQIKGGGPVTVTHPEMRRFFMLIQEAVQLVLHAAAVGAGDRLYILDMGEQIKLVDMARHLIRLSGYVPDEEIPIAYVGLRPGEKLSEELVGEGEAIRASAAPKILEIQTDATFDPTELGEQLAVLERHAARNDVATVLSLLSTIVPTYKPSGNLASARRSLPALAQPRRLGARTWQGPERRAAGLAERRAFRRGGRRHADLPARLVRGPVFTVRPSAEVA